MSDTDDLTDDVTPGASRRNFLAGAGLTGLALGAGVLSSAEAAGAAATAGKYAFDLDGAKAGSPVSASGGEPYGVIYSQPRGPGEVRDKYLTTVTVSDAVLSCGAGMSAAFYTGLAEFSTGGTRLHRGRITRRDDAGKVFHTAEFLDAWMTSLRLPAVERGSQGTARLGVTLSPDSAYFNRGGGPAQTPPTRPAWTTGAFSLTLDGISTAKVAKIGAMTVSRRVIEPQISGDERTLDDLEVSDLVVSFADPAPADVKAWFKDFVIDGNHRAKNERTGTIYYRDAKNRVLFTLKLAGLGIYKLTPASTLVGSERYVRTTASIYCESATFSASAAAAL